MRTNTEEVINALRTLIDCRIGLHQAVKLALRVPVSDDIDDMLRENEQMAAQRLAAYVSAGNGEGSLLSEILERL